MSSRSTTALAMALVAGCMASSIAMADTVRIVGVATEISENVLGSSVVMLDFEIPTLREGTGLEVVTATVGWNNSSIAQNQSVRFKTFDAAGAGVLDQVRENRATRLELVMSREPIGEDVIYPQDFQKTGIARFRIDVRDTVADLVSGPGRHLQLAVVTNDLESSVLGQSAENPVLTIHYGFLGTLKNVLGRSHD